ncbi:class I SAM-dependent methyltransferase [Amylibacter sp.]|jgi:ubiquinone/menaquinone biosynthesis C-methylase UbiE|nr:class I SAM-dependent methyltransferase [Amylibacter sp.]
MDQITLSEKRSIEVDFWKTNLDENPESNSIENVLNKAQQGLVFLSALELLNANGSYFESANDVIELGGGQGWASCILKRRFPHLNVTGSDISEFAIRSQFKWEHIFNVKLDDSVVCTSDDMPFEKKSFDIAFAFAAAHHFVVHRETLVECDRVLRPGGSLIYLYEPVTPRFFYQIAKWRVNRKRPEVPEDVLVPAELSSYASQVGFNYKIIYFPNIKSRGFVETVYYFLLSKVIFLNRLLPSTAIIVFTKPK